MEDNLNFRISSGLKNIIGKELITNEYVAIFELVKNSFDAHAKKVKITFENIYTNNAKIIIEDNGKGMDISDIKNKWLFVAYSAKKDGSEDSNEHEDYRAKLKSKRGFAGAKGVGRFSCDRLGSKLNMITIKDRDKSIVENIKVDWEKFEHNLHEEFVDIDVEHKQLQKHNYNIVHGTVLEITDLRDKWTRDNLLKLKSSLEKLINPNQQNDDFDIEIIVPDEIEKDKINSTRKQVNGIVKNTIFEVLKVKTTRILFSISADGEIITTSLEDRGKPIYKITEKNNTSLTDINIELFYLNRQAKFNFTKVMGVRPISYGSVFLYKNGFRIYPFGEEGEDPLKLDRRKIQGHRRYLGTRELIGRIEINGNNENFIETSSRDGGLIKNSAYIELMNVFLEKALKRLENYVVKIIKWGEPFLLNEIEHPSLNPEDVKKEIINYILKISNSRDVLNIEYDDSFIEIIEEKSEESVTHSIIKLKKEASESNNEELLKGIDRIGKEFKNLLTERQSLEEEKDAKDSELKKVSKDLEHTTKQNLFLRSISSSNTKDIVSLQHQINHGTVSISRNVNKLKESIKQSASPEELLFYINKISMENSKISTIARFVTKANFDLTANSITQDIVQFINQYIENVYKEYDHLKINNQILNVNIEMKEFFSVTYKFRPLEIIIILDNLLGNAQKAGAKNVFVNWSEDSESYKLSFKDDGKGIPDEIVDKVWDFGFTTTDGSGIGLYHIKELIDKMNWKIKINNKLSTGVEFIIEVKK